MISPFSAALDPVDTLDPSWRVLAARLPSGAWLDCPAIAVDPANRALVRVASGVLDEAALEALPRGVAAQACASGGEFTLTLSFARDPETGAYCWDITDDHGSLVDGGTGRARGRGLRAWQKALSVLTFEAASYASSLGDAEHGDEDGGGDGGGDDDALFIDAPEDLARARPARRARGGTERVF